MRCSTVTPSNTFFTKRNGKTIQNLTWRLLQKLTVTTKSWRLPSPLPRKCTHFVPAPFGVRPHLWFRTSKVTNFSYQSTVSHCKQVGKAWGWYLLGQSIRPASPYLPDYRIWPSPRFIAWTTDRIQSTKTEPNSLVPIWWHALCGREIPATLFCTSSSGKIYISLGLMILQRWWIYGPGLHLSRRRIIDFFIFLYYISHWIISCTTFRALQFLFFCPPAWISK